LGRLTEANYYQEIPWQLLESAGFPVNYCDLSLDQQRLIDFLIEDSAIATITAAKLENENAILEEYIEENISLEEYIHENCEEL
tara:strand:+ start:778 stop:1029 length:252 start_codon:yes stop_codon:yes gene_type:complete